MFAWLLLALILLTSFVAVPVPLNILLKTWRWVRGTLYLITVKDLPKKNPQSNYIKMDRPLPSTASGKRVMRVIFVRHGQSVWNSLFNSFGLLWPFRVVTSIITETWLYLTNPIHSLIIDSPLSSKGVKEAGALCAWVRGSKPQDLPHDAAHSVIVCSNLRRAMATAAIGLAPRLRVTGEHIVIDSALQEGSRNIDAQAINDTPQRLISTPVHKWRTALQLSTIFNPAFNTGNKKKNSNVFSRMDTFVKHVFGGAADGGYVPSCPATPDAPQRNSDLTTVIAVGHSGFIRCFFRRFLPEDSKHISKVKKLQTGGAVAFDLIRNEHTGEVYVDESSIKLLFRNFA